VEQNVARRRARGKPVDAARELENAARAAGAAGVYCATGP
jgi:hypothetical protein